MRNQDLTFLEFFSEFRRGMLLAEADARLTELIEAIQDTGGSGEITIKLPFKLNKSGQLECTPVVTAKKPKREFGTGIYFISHEGRLTRRDPNQMDIEDHLAERRASKAND
jgi:hypothetical protein